MKLLILTLLIVLAHLTSYSQCDSLKIDYQVDHLKRESKRKEIFFTRIPEDSLQINFNDGFDKTTVVIKIDGVQKALNNSTDESLGLTGSMTFKRPKPNTQIEITYNNSVSYIDYNEKYNMIHIWNFDCHLTVRHTNRMIIYE